MQKIALIFTKPHRRFNQLTGDWILVSPQRTLRPWQGQEETTETSKLPKYDKNCYLCPGNTRAAGKINPDYEDIFVFTNDFPALLPQVEESHEKTHQLLHCEHVGGTCRVLCFSPQHNVTLANMNIEDIHKVINVWAEQTGELGEIYNWIQIFENRGSTMGCSNPHPHCQIWATNTLPSEAIKENHMQKQYWQKNGVILLQEYAELEIQQQERMVISNQHWVVLVPFWATWPFETMIIPRRHIHNLPELTYEERYTLAEVLKQLLNKYNRLFSVSFPYSMGWHGAPYNNGDVHHWQLHAHYYPPLLRSATIRKFMVGYEMLAEAQRDLTPELAAQRLREI